MTMRERYQVEDLADQAKIEGPYLDDDWFRYYGPDPGSLDGTTHYEVHELGCTRDRCSYRDEPCPWHKPGCDCSYGQCQKGDTNDQTEGTTPEAADAGQAPQGEEGQAAVHGSHGPADPGAGVARGFLTLYHRTTPENVIAIYLTGQMVSRENTNEIFFSTEPGGHATGYGEALVTIRIPAGLARLDDEFPSGELHYAVKASDIQPHHFIVEAP